MPDHPATLGVFSRATVLVKPEPSRPTVANIEDCSITTDSVVAIAMVRTNAKMRRIVVTWGDGTVNTLRNRPGMEVTALQPQQLPAGTYKLTHAYAEPADRQAFEHFVVIKVEDESGGVDFCIRKITLTPRYRVTNYRTTLLASKCDSWAETRSEFDITLYVEGAVTNVWRWEPSESGFIVGGSFVTDGTPIVLDGSQVSRDLTVADPVVEVMLDIIERDPVYDDNLPNISQRLSALDVSGTIEGEVTETASGCTVKYRFDKEVTLIVPLPSFGQSVVVSA
jgi:hypothetical protein